MRAINEEDYIIAGTSVLILKNSKTQFNRGYRRGMIIEFPGSELILKKTHKHTGFHELIEDGFSRKELVPSTELSRCKKTEIRIYN